MRIGVLGVNQAVTDVPRLSYKRSIAEDLVRRGFAVWAIPSRVIKRVPPSGIKEALAKSDYSLIKKRISEPMVESAAAAPTHNAETAGSYKQMRIGNLALVFFNERLVRLEVSNGSETISVLKVKPDANWSYNAPTAENDCIGKPGA